MHRKISLDHTPQSQEIQEALDKLCKEYKDKDIFHTKFLTMATDTGDNHPITQKPYTLPLKHNQWVHEQLEKLEKAGIISRNVSPWSSHIVIVPKKAQPGEIHQRHSCTDYCTLNSLLPPVIMAHLKVQHILSLVPLPKIYGLYAVLNGSTIYSSLNCTSGYHNLSLSADA